MILTIVAALTILLLLIHPYAAKLKATGLWAGKAIMAPGTESISPRGAEDALTVGWISSLTFLSSITQFAIPVVAFFHAWWLSLACFFGIAMVLRLPSILPHPRAVDYYIGVLLTHLYKREVKFQAKNDLLRMDAARHLRGRLQELLVIYLGENIPAPTFRMAMDSPSGNMEWLMEKSAPKK